jgi:hypothetical protein
VVSTSGAGRSTTPESVGYSLKRLVLGKPLIIEQLKSERLSNPVALGVLSPDAISSSAYGTEEILIELLPYAGLAAFTLVLQDKPAGRRTSPMLRSTRRSVRSLRRVARRVDW